MDLLNSVQAVSGLLHGANQLVQSLKAPRVKSEDFAELLKQRLEAAQSPQGRLAALDQATARVNQLTARFLELHDANGDGQLSVEEAGMAEAAFARFDTNADGQVTLTELRQPSLTSINKLRMQWQQL